MRRYNLEKIYEVNGIDSFMLITAKQKHNMLTNRLKHESGMSILCVISLLQLIEIFNNWAASPENLSSGFATRVDSNRSAQSQ